MPYLDKHKLAWGLPGYVHQASASTTLLYIRRIDFSFLGLDKHCSQCQTSSAVHDVPLAPPLHSNAPLHSIAPPLLQALLPACTPAEAAAAAASLAARSAERSCIQRLVEQVWELGSNTLLHARLHLSLVYSVNICWHIECLSNTKIDRPQSC